MASTTPGRQIVSVATGPEWKRVAAALNAQDKSLGDKFRREVREASDVLAARARRAVLNIPTTGAKHTGLRGRVAKGVGTKITGSGVQITTSMDDRDEINLPAYLDSQRGWRHPVYGNRDVWVRQTTGGSWFRETISSGRDDVEDRLSDVMDDAARTISRAGTGR
jgi:hypothetical protein